MRRAGRQTEVSCISGRIATALRACGRNVWIRRRSGPPDRRSSIQHFHSKRPVVEEPVPWRAGHRRRARQDCLQSGRAQREHLDDGASAGGSRQVASTADKSCSPRAQMRLQEPARVRRLARGDRLPACRSTTTPAGVPALRPEIDHVIGGLDHVEVVLDQQHRVAGVDEPVQRGQQPLDVRQVQAGRRLVEDVDGVLRALQRAQLGRDLDRAAPRRPRASSPTGRASGSRGPRSSSTSIFLRDRRLAREERRRLPRPTCSARRRWSCRAA